MNRLIVCIALMLGACGGSSKQAAKDDLATRQDLATSGEVDLANASADFAATVEDLAIAVDMAIPADMKAPDDLVMPDLLPSPNYMFVTSKTYVAGALGGLAAADKHCNDLAADAHLPGTYVAFLSAEGTPNVDAKTRLGSARGWIRVDGKPFADTVDSIMTAHAVFYTPNLDETGASVGSDVTWTGTQPDGTTYTGQTCAGWTSASDSDSGFLGATVATGFHWMSQGSAGCAAAKRLYCFGVDRQLPVAVTKQTGRLAFVSKNAFTSGGGVSAADTQCANDATAQSFSGTFRALLATSTKAATDATRFDTSNGTPIWVRPDGVPIVAQASDLVAGTLVAPINETADGHYLDTSVFAGAATLNVAGTTATTCTNYTVTTGQFKRGDAEFTQYFWTDGQLDCTATNAHLYCLQN